MFTIKFLKYIVFVAFCIFMSSSAYAVTTSACQEAVNELKNLCTSGSNINGNKTKSYIENIKSNCFCGSLQSNNGGEKDSGICTNSAETKIELRRNRIISIDGDKKCPILLPTSGKNDFSNYSGFCKVEGSHKDVERSVKLMHKLDKNFVSNIATFQSMASNCEDVIILSNPSDIYAYRKNAGPYFFISHNDLDFYDIINKPNDIIFMAANAGLQLFAKENGQTIRANILSADDVRFNIDYKTNITFEGTINANIMNVNNQAENDKFVIKRADRDETCETCKLTDPEAEKSYKVFLSQETSCSPVKVTIQSCLYNSSCQDVTENVPVTIKRTGVKNTTTTDSIPPGGKYLSTTDTSKITVAPTSGNYTCNDGTAKSDGCSISLSGCTPAITGTVAYVNQITPFIINLPNNVPSSDSTILNYKAKFKFTMDSSTEFKVKLTDGSNSVITINNTNNTLNVPLTNVSPKDASYALLAPQFKFLDLVTPMDNLSIQEFLVIASSSTEDAEISELTNIDLKLTTIPLAFCYELDNKSYDTAIKAGQYYSFTSKAVGCRDNDELCVKLPLQKIESLSQDDLKNICGNGMLITNTQLLDDYNIDPIIDEKFLAISPDNINQWKNNPASDTPNYYLAECNYDSNDLTKTYCQADALAQGDDGNPIAFKFGYTSVKPTNLSISDLGWFSFSQTAPTLVGGSNGNKSFYYSPVYGSIPTALASADTNGFLTTDYNLDIKEIIDRYNNNKFPSELNIKHKIISSTCPAYYDEHLALSGFVSAVDANNKLVYNVISDYITSTDTGDGLNLGLYTKDSADSSQIIENKSLSSPKLSKKHTLFSGFPFYTDFTLDTPLGLSAKNLYIAYRAQMHYLLPDGSKEKITSKNNVCETLLLYPTEEQLSNCLNAIATRDDETEKTTYVLPVTNGQNPISFTKGRIVSEMITGNSGDIYVPITIQKYDSTANGWKINTTDSCTKLILNDPDSILQPSLSFINGVNKEVSVQSNGNLDLTNNGNQRSVVSLCTSRDAENCQLTYNFNKGTLLFKAKTPNNIDNDKSYVKFSVIAQDPTEADTLSLTKPINNLTHLVDYNTSRGGLLFREVKSNVRIVQTSEIFDTDK